MSESLGSEIHLPAPNGVIKEIRIDEKTGATTIVYGHCVGCGIKLEVNGDWSVDAKGCLVCKCCAHQHEGIAFCRQHFESDVINKREYKVLQAVRGKVRISQIKKIASMSSDQVDVALAELQQRELMVVKNFLIGKEYSVTDKGLSALVSGSKVFLGDGDLSAMALKMVEVGAWPRPQ